MPLQLASARSHYRLSALIARRAVREARKAAPRGANAVASVVALHQVTQATRSQAAVGEMLAEQSINVAADALLNTLTFTTSVNTFTTMLSTATPDLTALNSEFDRLVESLVQDAGRAAESVSTTTRLGIGHVRYLSPPSCARCAILAGRWYRWSEGFKRHPNCDCVMVPARQAAGPDLVADPTDLLREGKIAGLSKADQRALADGADLGRVVNVRLQKAGLSESGRVLSRRGRLTPEGIYASSNTREEALAALQQAGYIL